MQVLIGTQERSILAKFLKVVTPDQLNTYGNTNIINVPLDDNN